jgi:hypothetical protein
MESILTTTRCPSGLGSAGRKLWTSISGDWHLDPHESALLLQAARCADNLDRLAAAVGDAVMTVNGKGDPCVNPALVEFRQASLTLSRLLSALRVPEGETGLQPQRRPVRGTYSTGRQVRRSNSPSNKPGSNVPR